MGIGLWVVRSRAHQNHINKLSEAHVKTLNVYECSTARLLVPIFQIDDTLQATISVDILIRLDRRVDFEA